MIATYKTLPLVHQQTPGRQCPVVVTSEASARSIGTPPCQLHAGAVARSARNLEAMTIPTRCSSCSTKGTGGRRSCSSSGGSGGGSAGGGGSGSSRRRSRMHTRHRPSAAAALLTAAIAAYLIPLLSAPRPAAAQPPAPPGSSGTVPELDSGFFTQACHGCNHARIRVTSGSSPALRLKRKHWAFRIASH